MAVLMMLFRFDEISSSSLRCHISRFVYQFFGNLLPNGMIFLPFIPSSHLFERSNFEIDSVFIVIEPHPRPHLGWQTNKLIITLAFICDSWFRALIEFFGKDIKAVMMLDNRPRAYQLSISLWLRIDLIEIFCFFCFLRCFFFKSTIL